MHVFFVFVFSAQLYRLYMNDFYSYLQTNIRIHWLSNDLYSQMVLSVLLWDGACRHLAPYILVSCYSRLLFLCFIKYNWWAWLDAARSSSGDKPIFRRSSWGMCTGEINARVHTLLTDAGWWGSHAMDADASNQFHQLYAITRIVLLILLWLAMFLYVSVLYYVCTWYMSEIDVNKDVYIYQQI